MTTKPTQDDLAKLAMNAVTTGRTDAAAVAAFGANIGGAMTNQLRRAVARATAEQGATSTRVQSLNIKLDAITLDIASARFVVMQAHVAVPATDPTAFTIYGSVVDTTGAPLPGVTVAALDPKQTVVGQACTGRDGTFVLALPAATDKDGKASAPGSVTLRASDATKKILFTGTTAYPIVAGNRTSVTIAVDPATAYAC